MPATEAPEQCRTCKGSGFVKVAHGEVIEDYDMTEAMMHEDGDPPLQKKLYGAWERRPCPTCKPLAPVVDARHT